MKYYIIYIKTTFDCVEVQLQNIYLGLRLKAQILQTSVIS